DVSAVAGQELCWASAQECRDPSSSVGVLYYSELHKTVGFAQVTFVQRNHEIQAFSSYGSDQPFAVCIRLRRPNRGAPMTSMRPILLVMRRDREDCFDDRALSAWFDLLDVRAQQIFTLRSHATA